MSVLGVVVDFIGNGWCCHLIVVGRHWSVYELVISFRKLAVPVTKGDAFWCIMLSPHDCVLYRLSAVKLYTETILTIYFLFGKM